MAANVETMYSTRVTPWHGMGIIVKEAPTSADAIRLAGLDWNVERQNIYTENGIQIPGNYVNIRDVDGKPLGIVGDRYQIVQNRDAFDFTDSLLGEGVRYETAGSLNGGRTIWLLALLPDEFTILGDKVDPYVVFTNTHDGSGSVRVAMTPVRVVCQNTLNMAMRNASRTWSTRHTGNINSKLNDASDTLKLAHAYMESTKETFEDLYKVKLNDISLRRMVNDIVPIDESKMTETQIKNAKVIQLDIIRRYNDAPDLIMLDKTGARLIQAVADTTTHIEPFRRTANYKENKFLKTIDGNKMLDRALDVVLSA